jgi:hypothetical protein
MFAIEIISIATLEGLDYNFFAYFFEFKGGEAQGVI